jgi:ubiquinone/menaquinone biosynthesis C-methylase UbiE
MNEIKEYNQLIYDTQYSDANLAFPTKEENPYQYELKEIKIQLLHEYCQGKRVLDMGCGTGKYSFIAAQLAEEVVGVDFSENMLSYFRDELKQSNIKNITILQGNIKSLPEEIKSEYFDVVFSYAVLYHVDKVEEALREMHRVLKPSTRFITMRGSFELRLFSKKINGKMLDEIISSSFPLRYFAFRYLFVCQKEG